MVTKEMYEKREKPWDSIGTSVVTAKTTKEVLEASGLAWETLQKSVFTEDGTLIPGVRANVRSDNDYVLGIVSSKYTPVNNSAAFEFLDELVGKGLIFEKAGTLGNGKSAWIACKLPERWIIESEEIALYIIITNSHDGSGSLRCFVSPVRCLCANSLNFALANAKRGFHLKHVGDVESKMRAAGEVMLYADTYMQSLAECIHTLRKIILSEDQIQEYVEKLLPIEPDATDVRKKNVLKLREDLLDRYYNAPDLKSLGEASAYRFLNAVSDHQYHLEPLKKRDGYKESMFAQTLTDNTMLNKAYQLVMAA